MPLGGPSVRGGKFTTPPPRDWPVLERWAACFALAGDQRSEVFDPAALARHEVPADMASDRAVMGALLVFFRAVRGQELSRGTWGFDRHRIHDSPLLS